jgi:hypothetical protein
MVDNFDREAMNRKWQTLQAEEQSAWADYQAHKANGDPQAAADAAEQAFAVRDRAASFARHCQAQTAQPQYQPVSEETRSKRTVPEMDVWDHVKMWNDSRYAGLGGKFTAQDVQNEFSKLGHYKRTRGSETR